jgi:two-component system LytT family response regulator
MYIESEGAYTFFVLSNKEKEISSRNLGSFEDKLPADRFFRIHHSYIVNINYIERVERGESLFVQLTDGETRLPISQRRSKAFFEHLGKV